MAFAGGHLLLHDRRLRHDLVDLTLFITAMKNLKFLLVGMCFGIILIKSEVISWFRIQEMFRLQSFHMYGIIGSAIVVAMISILLIKRFNIKTIHQEAIIIPDKQFNWGYVYGGLIFGLGWALTGACPGPIFAQIGSGILVTSVTLLSAIAGTWVYGLLREKLPH
ncbi:YeeE/YedE family protein [Mucilaginibacter robiniae]|uniref:YeeE/YedE family protein n=2 Tax=Mucilaginibacter robiniae TaxID=2728022 RepID=A0A7L5E1A5_9SPHI|nr:YeeE/YedE family protein [Mucilaginibacter robiniae]